MLRARTVTLLALTIALRSSVAPASPLDDAVTARCALDPRLAPAARGALSQRDPLDPVALRALAEGAGLPAPSVRSAVFRGTEAARVEAITSWLEGRPVTSLARCALQTEGDRTAVVLVPRHADVSPLDPSVAPGGTRDYTFSLPEGARGATLVVAPPGGEVQRQPVTQGEPASVSFPDEGRYTLQLLAVMDSGPAPLATWHVQAGRAAPAREARPEADTVRGVLSAINALRARAGVAPLRPDPLLSVVAREQASALAARGAVAHATAPGDSPVARLRAAHLVARRVAENVARARTLTEAHAHLAGSPSHLANLLDPALDAAGLGVSERDGVVYLVELLASRPSLSGD